MKITIPKDVDIIHKRVKNDRCSVPLLIIIVRYGTVREMIMHGRDI